MRFAGRMFNCMYMDMAMPFEAGSVLAPRFLLCKEELL